MNTTSRTVPAELRILGILLVRFALFAVVAFCTAGAGYTLVEIWNYPGEPMTTLSIGGVGVGFLVMGCYFLQLDWKYYNHSEKPTTKTPLSEFLRLNQTPQSTE